MICKCGNTKGYVERTETSEVFEMGKLSEEKAEEKSNDKIFRCDDVSNFICDECGNLMEEDDCEYKV